MSAYHLILELRQRLDPDGFKACIHALRQEPLAWQAVSDPTGGEILLEQALDSFPNDPHIWTVAALALLESGSPISIKNIQDPEWVGLEPELHHESEECFAAWLGGDPANSLTLTQAGLISLALRSRQVFHGNWQFLHEIPAGILTAANRSTSLVIACLAGMTPEPLELLAALFEHDPSLGVHGFLCIPATEAEQASNFSALLHKLDQPAQLEGMLTLACTRPDLAAHLDELAPAIEATTSDCQAPAAKKTFERVQPIAELAQRARLLTISQHPELALQLYQKALQLNRSWQAYLQGQMALAYGETARLLSQADEPVDHLAGDLNAGRAEDFYLSALQSWEESVQTDPEQPEARAHYAWALLDQGRRLEAQEILGAAVQDDLQSSTEPDFLFWATQARLAADLEDFEPAVSGLAKAIEQFCPQADHWQTIVELIKVGNKIGASGEAIQLANLALEMRPDDPLVLKLSAQAQLAAGQAQPGLDHAELAFALAPSWERRKVVIQALEANLEWDEALHEYQELFSELDVLTPADWRGMAACALQSGQLDKAIQASRQALELDPQDGLAIELLGQIAAADGNYPVALEYFQYAVQMSPEQPTTWLSLAGRYQADGQSAYALETLRQANQANPTSAEINLELGRALLSEDSPTLALIPLRNAMSLALRKKKARIPDLSLDRLIGEIALALGRTLCGQGFLEEARQTYEKVLGPLPHEACDPCLSFDYAKTLLGLGQTAAALPWLENTITLTDSQPARFEQARSILALEPTPAETATAIALLRQVLADQDLPADQRPLSPDTYAEAYALLAESLHKTGDLPGAIQAYRRALDSCLIQQPAWRGRLSFGLGQSALSLGQPETAITAFLEALQAEPDNPTIYQNLSEAYAAIDLTDDAFQAATRAVRMKSNSPEFLIWYVEQCLRLHDRPTGKALPAYEYAQQALERAISLAPERADLLTRLAGLQILRGNKAGALDTLDKFNDPQIDQMNLSADILRQAAELMCKIDAPAQAALILEQAIQLVRIEHPQDEALLLTALLLDLGDAQYAAGNLPAGLDALNQAIELSPAAVGGFRLKSANQLAQDDLAGAAETLDQALALEPENVEILLQSALVQQASEALAPALAHAEAAVKHSTSTANPTLHEFAEWLAALLANGSLRSRLFDGVPVSSSQSGLSIELAFQQAEQAFRAVDLQAATAALSVVLESVPHHPHLLALQARLVGRQEGVNDTSLELLESAIRTRDFAFTQFTNEVETQMQAFDHPFYKSQIERLLNSSIVLGIAEAVIELKQWQYADTICAHALDLAPGFPSSLVLRGRALVERAEMQQLYQEIKVVRHAPGSNALDGEAWKDCLNDLRSKADRVDSDNQAELQTLNHWLIRGEAIFNPGPQANADLVQYAENAPLTVADLAAVICSLRQDQQIDLAGQWAARLPAHPLTQLQLAIALASSQPERAIAIIQQSIERLAEPDLDLPEPEPLLKAYLAILCHGLLAKPDQWQTGFDAIRSALDSWPDEANWHSLAASYLLETSEPESAELNSQALSHLETAVRLEPTNSAHHLRLGGFYREHGRIEKALVCFEKATEVAPDQPATWLELARLQKSTGQYEDAIASVEAALACPQTGEPLDALLLRSELALLTNNPRGALSRAQMIMNSSPEQTEAWCIAAKALVALGQPAEALRAVEHVIVRPGIPLEAERLRIEIIHTLRGPQAAIELIQKLLEMYPNDPILNANLADYWMELNEPIKAVTAARIALQTGQQDLSTDVQSHLHLMMGSLSRQAGQLDQAVYHLNEAIRKSPQSIDAYLELGRVHQDRRQHNQAMEIYQMATKIAPNDYHAYYLAGLALKDSKDYLGAENMFRRAAHLAPNEVNIHRQLAAVVALNLVHNRRIPIPD